MMAQSWSEWWHGLEAGGELAQARQRIAELEVKLQIEELRTEEMGMLLEHLRLLIQANVAAATQVGIHMGVPQKRG